MDKVRARRREPLIGSLIPVAAHRHKVELRQPGHRIARADGHVVRRTDHGPHLMNLVIVGYGIGPNRSTSGCSQDLRRGHTTNPRTTPVSLSYRTDENNLSESAVGNLICDAVPVVIQHRGLMLKALAQGIGGPAKGLPHRYAAEDVCPKIARERNRALGNEMRDLIR